MYQSTSRMIFRRNRPTDPSIKFELWQNVYKKCVLENQNSSLLHANGSHIHHNSQPIIITTERLTMRCPLAFSLVMILIIMISSSTLSAHGNFNLTQQIYIIKWSKNIEYNPLIIRLFACFDIPGQNPHRRLLQLLQRLYLHLTPLVGGVWWVLLNVEPFPAAELAIDRCPR